MLIRVRTWRTDRTGARRRWAARSLAPMAAAVVLAACGWAKADPDPPKISSIETLAAHAAARCAIMDLKYAGNPTPRDYKVAQELLAVAAALIRADAERPREGTTPPPLPDQQTILRLYLEAATGAGDTQTVREITRELVKLDRTDSVSLLRAIGFKISDLQSVEDRLATYDKFLGDDGPDLDPAILSRLALDSALLLRERGDLEGFADRLATACDLDKTNKDAAMLTLAFYSENMTDPRGLFELRLNVLNADPFDAAIYSAIVDQLLQHGAYKGAFRFARLHRRLTQIQGVALSPEEEQNYDLAEWNTSGPEAVIRRLSNDLERARQYTAEARKRALEADPASTTIPKPENVHLPLARERSRFLCAAALGDMERASIFLTEINAIIAQLTSQLADPLVRPKAMTDEDAQDLVRQMRADRTWLRLWSGLQTEDAADEMADLVAKGFLDPDGQTRLGAWLDIRRGRLDEAEVALGRSGSTDPLARLGMAVIADLRADVQTAIVRFADVVAMTPGDAAAAFARGRYAALVGASPRPDEIARTLESDAASSPEWLEVLVENPRKMMSLEATVLRPDINPVDRTPVRITLRNTSPVPLALGPDKPLNSRLMLAPIVDLGAGRLAVADLGMVASLDRRLRLMKDESVSIIVWPDIGPVSQVMEIGVSRRARVRWRVLQGFMLNDLHMHDAGPQCLTAEVASLERKLPSRTEAVFEAMKYYLQTGGPREIADAILSIQLQIAQATPGQGVAAQDIDNLMEAMARRFGSWDAKQRAAKVLVLCTLFSQTNVPPVVRIDNIALRDTDEDVLAVALATRVARTDDPLLTAPNVLKSPRLTALAQAVKERIDEKRPTYAGAVVSVPQMVRTARIMDMTPPAPTENVSVYDPPPVPSKVPKSIIPGVAPDPSPVPVVP